MELKATITDAGVIYLPNEVRESFGKHVKLIPNALAAVLFPADADLELVRDSVRIILDDIELRIRTPQSRSRHKSKEASARAETSRQEK
jgi:hypothetical protein